MYTLSIASFVLILDQLSKYLVVSSMTLGQSIPLFPSVNLHLAYNQGAAFGILASQGGWQRWLFVAIALSLSVFIWVWATYYSKHKYEKLALSLLLGGAIGNMFDRIRFGFVIDFVDFYIGNWHWYTFNIADTAICIGAGIIILLTLFSDNPKA